MVEDQNKHKITPDEVREKNLSPLLETDYDVQALMVTPQAGKGAIDEDTKKFYAIDTQQGNKEDRKKLSVWKLFSIVTSDNRLSNYTSQQEKAARFYMKMEGWCLDEGMTKPAATARWMGIALSECSLGRAMALRNNLQEVRQKMESLMVEQKPEKKTFLGL